MAEDINWNEWMKKNHVKLPIEKQKSKEKSKSDNDSKKDRHYINF